MKYNKTFSGEPFEIYQSYLETIKNKLSTNLYEFISDSRRHDLAEKSLHDSWINEISIKVNRDKENRNLEKLVEIKLELLGSYHDRIFTLKFIDVVSYQINIWRQNCDLITYEVYLENFGEKENLVFHAEFDRENSIIIKSQAIEIFEEFIR